MRSADCDGVGGGIDARAEEPKLSVKHEPASHVLLSPWAPSLQAQVTDFGAQCGLKTSAGRAASAQPMAPRRALIVEKQHMVRNRPSMSPAFDWVGRGRLGKRRGLHPCRGVLGHHVVAIHPFKHAAPRVERAHLLHIRLVPQTLDGFAADYFVANMNYARTIVPLRRLVPHDRPEMHRLASRGLLRGAHQPTTLARSTAVAWKFRSGAGVNAPATRKSTSENCPYGHHTRPRSAGQPSLNERPLTSIWRCKAVGL